MACRASEPLRIDWRVGSGFGLRRLHGNAPRHHEGWDIGAPRGTPILAVLPGTVLHAFTQGTRGFSGYGNGVVLAHPGGLWSISAHMNEPPAVVRGQQIAAGQVIGKVGDSDSPGAVHLHLAFARRAWPKVYGRDGVDPSEVFALLGLTLDSNRRPQIARGSLLDCDPASPATSPAVATTATVPVVPPPDLSRFWESPGTPGPLDERGPAIGIAGAALALGIAAAAVLSRLGR